MALELISKYTRIGRKQLAKRLDVGEGSVRTILNQLKTRGLITSSRGGHALTPKGERWLARLQKFVRVEAGKLAVGKVSVATVVRGAAAKVKRGLEQRDAAIKAGARGATVLVFRGGEFRLPGEFMEVGKKEGEALIAAFKPRESDVVVIGTGDDTLTAELGARAAVRTLTTRA